MTISAKVSSTELTGQVSGRFANSNIEALLLDADGVTYDPSNDAAADATFISTYEVPDGTGGYRRQVITYDPSDVGGYADDGVALSQRAVVFENTTGSFSFTHLALVWGSGNIQTTNTPGLVPASGINGTYTGFNTTTDGSGKGAVVNVEVTNNGAAATDFIVTIQSAGFGYAVGDTLTIANADLQAAGLTVDTNNLAFTVATEYTPSNAGEIISVAQVDARVTVTNGNSTAFYINTKLFGYYTV